MRSENGHVAILRDAIRCSFPNEPYTGRVTPNDQLDDPDLDEAMRQFRVPEQQLTVHSLLADFAERGAFSFTNTYKCD